MSIDHDHNDLDPKMAERFAKLRNIPPRDGKRTADGRAAFLTQARELAQKNLRPAPVSPAPRNRHILWTHTIAEAFKRKELNPMFTKIMAVLIAATLVFGGAAATAYASQASLPNDALYGVKTFGENLRLSLAPQPNAKLGIALEIAQRRVQEMAALSEMDIEIPVHLASQYQEQVEYALIAAEMPDDEIVPALEQVRTKLQEQLRIMEQLHQAQPEDPALVQAREQLRNMEQLHQAQPEDPALVQAREQVRIMEQLHQAQSENPALVQAREQLRQQLRLVELGLVDPLQYRAQIRHRQQFGFGPAPTEPPGPMVTPPVPGNQAGPGNENANSNGNGNQIQSGNSSGQSDNNGNGNNGNGNGDDNGGDDNDKGDRDDDNGGGDDDGGGGGDDGGGGHGNGG